MTEYPSRRVTANGIDTHYIEVGSGEPVIFVHGGGAGADGYGNWSRTLPALGASFRAIAVDMLGFGKTGKPDGAFEYSQAARNAHLVGFIEALGLRHASLVGNSMGGATAIGVAVERPDLVDKLVLMGSAGLTTEISPALKPVIHYDFTRDGMVALIRALTNDGFRIDDALVSYRYAASIEPDARRAYGRTMQWVKDQGGLSYAEGYIARVRAPTLVVNGKNDKVVPLKVALRFLDLIPRSWGYIIPSCGHWAMIEHADDFAATTRNFLSQANA
jgi:2-hydroxy-6-oxo-6-(2'-aminophenyl)hexa-2,4-dienoate hydrolase